ncbi:hypothetical protein J7444_19245 [Labrenzia sp. R4_1]|uniref:hypothetical protein n=1 Tax=Labrenzia sp. R4_1 TaxID=2821106 RepID=UPI001AD9B2A3|nr:hypothetical protein [Labrenzia sp. R4_1]MBO9426881.1 hypothetical protein [Labrenzia sp. R4_1]
MHDQRHKSKRLQSPHEDVLVNDLIPRVAHELHKRFAARLSEKPEPLSNSKSQLEDEPRIRSNRARRRVPVRTPFRSPCDTCEQYQRAPLPLNLHNRAAAPPTGIR